MVSTIVYDLFFILEPTWLWQWLGKTKELPFFKHFFAVVLDRLGV